MCQFCSQKNINQDDASYLEQFLDLAKIKTINASNSSLQMIQFTQLQRLKGNNQDNRLVGTPNQDTIRGGGGNDTIQGRGGQDSLSGGIGDDRIFGGNGNDRLSGGMGQDTLSGGQGKDAFILQKADGRLARIKDFQSGSDRILIDKSGFKLNLGSGQLSSSRFKRGSQATKASQRFVYQRSSGQLFFDPDGKGRKEKIKIASFVPKTKLIASDISLVGAQQTTTSQPSNQNFDITINYLDTNLSQTQKRVFKQAASRWESIIIGDLPNVRLSNGNEIDDIQIDIRAPFIDGSGNILGQANPTNLRAASQLPYSGIIEFDKADISDAEAKGILDELITHEIGHILGFGGLWPRFNLLSGAGGNNPRYTGSLAIREYNDLFNTNVNSIPLENKGGEGTRDFHWRESVFGNELMSGFLGQGASPLSRISLAAMADLGYQVNLNAADTFA